MKSKENVVLDFYFSLNQSVIVSFICSHSIKIVPRSECFQFGKTVSRMLPVHGAVQERGEGVGEVDGEEM